MPIDNVSSVSSLQSKNVVTRDSQSFSDDGAGQENFASALSEQKNRLQEAKNQAETPEQLHTIDKEKAVDDPQQSAVEHSELVALLEKYLPTPEESVTADLPSTNNVVNSSEQNSLPETVTKDLSSEMALTGLAFVKPVSGEAKLNPPVDNLASGDGLQKASFLQQPTQEVNDLNLMTVDKTTMANDASSIDKQSFLASLEKAMPDVNTDMLPGQRQVDGRPAIQTITTPVTHPNWGKDLGEQIMWLNNKDISAAEIRLNPAHLGPISVRIDVNQDQQTSIMFTAQHLDVKEALEASLPKLREMLVNQQVNLVNVNISQHSNPDQGRSQPNPFGSAVENQEQGLDDMAGLESSGLGQGVVNKGLLSLYA